MKEHNQFRLRLNLFDGIVLVLALAAAVFLMWRFTRPAAASGQTDAEGSPSSPTSSPSSASGVKASRMRPLPVA